MSRARKPRSVAIELPHSGAVRGSLTYVRDVGHDQSSASATVTVEARTASVRPDLACMSRTTSSMPSEQRVLGVDHHVDAVAEHVEIGVRDQRGHLDQRVLAQIEPGHLAVDPDQKIVHDHSLVARRHAGAATPCRNPRLGVCLEGWTVQRRGPGERRRIARRRASATADWPRSWRSSSSPWRPVSCGTATGTTSSTSASTGTR